jgi:hypothetical protein
LSTAPGAGSAAFHNEVSVRRLDLGSSSGSLRVGEPCQTSVKRTERYSTSPTRTGRHEGLLRPARDVTSRHSITQNVMRSSGPHPARECLRSQGAIATLRRVTGQPPHTEVAELLNAAPGTLLGGGPVGSAPRISSSGICSGIGGLRCWRGWRSSGSSLSRPTRTNRGRYLVSLVASNGWLSTETGPFHAFRADLSPGRVGRRDVRTGGHPASADRGWLSGSLPLSCSTVYVRSAPPVVG